MKTKWKIAAFIWLSILLIAVLASYILDVSLGWTIVIIVIAMLINGLVAEIEDRSPGGFLNPANKGDKQDKAEEK
jgi:hypothetical protein